MKVTLNIVGAVLVLLVESFPIRDLPPNQKFRVAGAASK
jgi:hypothetical protein